MQYFYDVPCLPVRVEYDVSYYTTEQIDLYGFPDSWGVYNYLVISSMDYEKPPMTDWKYEQYMFGFLLLTPKVLFDLYIDTLDLKDFNQLFINYWVFYI